MSSRESKMVVVERDEAGKPTVWCDPEIVDLVTALNKGGIPTVASCSGHGVMWGNIALLDGRELFIAPDFNSAREFDRANNPAVERLQHDCAQCKDSGWFYKQVPQEGKTNIWLPFLCECRMGRALKASLGLLHEGMVTVVPKTSDDISHETAYITDCGDVLLTPEFIAEAESRWPGSESYERWNEETEKFDMFTQPNWDRKVLIKMTEYVMVNAHYKIHSLEQIGL